MFQYKKFKDNEGDDTSIETTGSNNNNNISNSINSNDDVGNTSGYKQPLLSGSGGEIDNGVEHTDIFIDEQSVPDRDSEIRNRKHAKHSEDLRNIFASNKKNEDEIKGLKNKSERGFYYKQNELIDQFLTPLNEDADDEDDEDDIKVKIAINGSLLVNIALFTMQITAAIWTGSLALVATSIDAFMDLLSGFILFMTARARKKRNYFEYPTGKSRMEPIGIIIFAALMSTVSINLLMEGTTTLIKNEQKKTDLSILSIVLVVIAIACKILMYLYCRVLTHSPSAMTLALDHRNDITVNSFGISMAILGYYVRWWLDPTGALIVALIILRSWTSQAYEQIQLLVGKTASPEFLQRLTYIALTHSPEVLKVDTCRAFHVGNNLFCEVDIVLPPDMPLSKTHDIGESLQIKLETLPEVERAFVHVDYEFRHKPEHKRVN